MRARWLVTNAGVRLADAHEALADAEATAARRMWDEWLAFGETMAWPAPPRLGLCWCGAGSRAS